MFKNVETTDLKFIEKNASTVNTAGKVWFSLSNSRRHVANAEVYWKKHYHVGKKVTDVGFV